MASANVLPVTITVAMVVRLDPEGESNRQPLWPIGASPYSRLLSLSGSCEPSFAHYTSLIVARKLPLCSF